jgi:hypothetical protein
MNVHGTGTSPRTRSSVIRGDILCIASGTMHYIEGYLNPSLFVTKAKGGDDVATKLESEFVLDLKEELTHRFPGCFIYKLDPNQVQGIPDLLVLWRSYWAVLETKRGLRSVRQPNQEYYVDQFNEMSFAAFVHPLNYRDVLDELERVFGL